MRYLLRLAGLAILLWLHHPLLASPASSPAEKATPPRERDTIAVQVIFTYGHSHTKTLANSSTIRFASERSGAFGTAPIKAWTRSSSIRRAGETSAWATA